MKMSLKVTDKMKILSLGFSGVTVDNFHYTRFEFNDSKAATKFCDDIRKIKTSLKKDFGIELEIDRFPSGKKEQPIVRIKGLGKIASQDFEQWNSLMQRANRFLIAQKIDEEGDQPDIVNLGDKIKDEKRDIASPEAYIVDKFKNGNVVHKGDLVGQLNEKFNLDKNEAITMIESWWKNHENLGEFDTTLDSYIINNIDARNKL
jgi:hypothetical protein